MEILLHLGAHRCASTTFQTYLWNNRIKLTGQGLTAWTPKRTRDGLMRGMIRHPALISVQDERHAMHSIGRLRVEMARLRNARQKALLIAEENLIGSMRNNILDTRLYPLVNERLMRFEPVFGDQRLTIALCVRSYEGLWTSTLVNLISSGWRLPSQELSDHLTTQPRRWRTLVRDIAAVFPDANIIVWPFEQMANRPEAQLRSMWGQDFHGLENAQLWRNRGANLVQLNTALALRGEPAISEGLVDAGTRWSPFNEDQIAVLRAEYRRDLAWLKAGAEGLARYIDGRSAPTPQNGGTPNLFATRRNQMTGSGRSTSAPRPDRAETTRTAAITAALRGQDNGIQESQFKDTLGRPRPH